MRFRDYLSVLAVLRSVLIRLDVAQSLFSSSLTCERTREKLCFSLMSLVIIVVSYFFLTTPCVLSRARCDFYWIATSLFLINNFPALVLVLWFLESRFGFGFGWLLTTTPLPFSSTTAQYSLAAS